MNLDKLSRTELEALAKNITRKIDEQEKPKIDKKLAKKMQSLDQEIVNLNRIVDKCEFAIKTRIDVEVQVGYTRNDKWYITANQISDSTEQDIVKSLYKQHPVIQKTLKAMAQKHKQLNKMVKKTAETLNIGCEDVSNALLLTYGPF